MGLAPASAWDLLPHQWAAVRAQSCWRGGGLALGWEGSPDPSSAAAHINHCVGVFGLGKRRLCGKRCLGRGGSDELCWRHGELAPR